MKACVVWVFGLMSSLLALLKLKIENGWLMRVVLL